jgi:hypothetical protein
MDKSQGRVSRDGAAAELPPVATHSGHRGLVMDETLIFEQGVEGRCGLAASSARDPSACPGSRSRR